jgi:phosphate/sulfate permease
MSNQVRKITFIVMLTGALASLGLTVQAGRNNHSILLMMLFGIWVFSPFMGLAVAYFLSNRWSVLTRNVLYLLAVVLTIASILIYSGVWTLSGVKHAFAFLIFPLLSWIILAVVIPVTASRSRRQG